MRITVTAGPDAGHSVVLGPGRHLIGRARGCAVVLADPTVEAHHALVTIGADGATELTQLSARLAIAVDGGTRRAGGPVPEGAVVELGDSRVAFGSRIASAPQSGDAVGVLAAVERATYLARARSPWVVELGRGDVRLALACEADASFAAAAQLARGELHRDVPVLADLAARHTLVVAVRGDAAGRVIALIRQLLAGRRATGRRVLTLAGPHVELPTSGPPATVLLALGTHDELPDGCHALLELGARWRATWTADLAGSSGFPVRFHLGIRLGTPRPGIVEQVARPGAELGGDVVGVEDPAHAER